MAESLNVGAYLVGVFPVALAGCSRYFLMSSNYFIHLYHVVFCRKNSTFHAHECLVTCFYLFYESSKRFQTH